MYENEFETLLYFQLAPLLNLEIPEILKTALFSVGRETLGVRKKSKLGTDAVSCIVAVMAAINRQCSVVVIRDPRRR